MLGSCARMRECFARGFGYERGVPHLAGAARLRLAVKVQLRAGQCEQLRPVGFADIACGVGG